MRKIALIAMLAIVGAMVPMSTASSVPTPNSLDGVGTLMFINPGLGSIDLWIKIEGEFTKFEIASPSQNEIQLPTGDHTFKICTSGSSSEACAFPAAPLGPGGTIHVESNDILNAMYLDLALPGGVTGSRVDIQEDDDSKTETDHAKLEVYNFWGGGALDMCVGGEHVISLPLDTGTAPHQVAEFDSKDGEGQEWLIFAAGAPLNKPFPGTCDPAAALAVVDQGFPTGSNLVFNFAGLLGGICSGNCAYLIFPGEEPGSSSNNVDAFCQVVLEAANITPWLQDLFSEVEVGNPDTYPSKERVEKVITRIAELLEKGNQTAPADIRQAWLTATAEFVRTGQLAAAEYDLNRIPQDDLRDLTSLIDNPQADDEEAAAAIAELTAWVPVNCFGAVETEPSFTG